MSPIPFTSPSLTYLSARPSKEPTISPDGSSITFLTEPKTDWWRTREIDSSSGVVFGLKRKVGEGFEVSVDLSIDNQVQFDQATIFLHISPTCWVKAGIEFDLGKVWHGGVVCNPYSDWSLTPHLPTHSSRFTLTLSSSTLRIYIGADMIREVHDFGKGGEGEEVFVGVMGCSPLGGGVEAVFRGLEIKEGVRAV